MSGHSKWSKIKNKKGTTDAKRGNLFTKLGKAITIVAQQGGGDPEMNFSLRIAIEKAKGANMPKDNIEKAVKRGAGELKDGAQLQEVMYEGFGTKGVAVIVECVTDNTNRTISEVKNVFNKAGGSMGGSGSVSWQFQHLGVVHLAEENKEKVSNKKDEFELALIDAGADDIIDNETDLEIRASIENLQKVLEAVQKFEIEPDESGLEWVAKETIELDEEGSAKMEKLYDALDDLEDVDNIYTNEA